MCTHMSKTIKEERLKWVLPIISKEISLKAMAMAFPHGKRTLERWVAAYKQGGADALEPHSTRPKSHPNETPIGIRRKAIEARKKSKQCALKISWDLADKGIKIKARTIGKILRAEGLVRKYRIKRIKYKYLKAERKAGELMEIDVKHVPGPIKNKRYYQYTAIDAATRWRHLEVYDAECNFNSIRFLKEVIRRFPHKILAIKTDNGAIFTNYYTGTNKRSDQTVKNIHELDLFCSHQGIIHYLIDPGKPAQNGTVERSHREDQEKFYEQNIFKNFNDLQRKLKRWNIYYNNLRHCGLNGKTPNQALLNH